MAKTSSNNFKQLFFFAETIVSASFVIFCFFFLTSSLFFFVLWWHCFFISLFLFDLDSNKKKKKKEWRKKRIFTKAWNQRSELAEIVKKKLAKKVAGIVKKKLQRQSCLFFLLLKVAEKSCTLHVTTLLTRCKFALQKWSENSINLLSKVWNNQKNYEMFLQ